MPKNEEPHPSIRGYFAHSLYGQMSKDEEIVVLTGDLGFGMLDRIRNDFPDRFFNVGSSEQALMGIAVGMAMEGKKPFAYSISPFLLYRPFETVIKYIQGENIPVRLIGSGYEQDYEHDGPSHHIYKAPELFSLMLPGVHLYMPQTKEEVPSIVASLVEINEPACCILRR